MTAAAIEVSTPAIQPVWSSPIDAGRYDRRFQLTDREREALNRLEMNLRRRRGHDADAPEWAIIDRLLRPLDDAVAGLHWSTDNTRMHRGFAGDAVALVLLRCADQNRAFWCWSSQDWVRLIGTSIDDFQKPWPIRFDVNVRPYVAALAYLLGGFTDFHRLGPFGRLSLARRIFGQRALDDAHDQVARILTQWGYRIGLANNQRLMTALGEALLINRSPHLHALRTETFDRLRQNPAMAGRHSHALHCIQKAVASLGFCDERPSPPPTPRADIEGAPPPWAEMVERWYATSTLTPKVRTSWRSVLSKAGRWLADQHPDVTEPARWTRQTCAAWIAAIDRMAVGDYVQHRKGLGKKVGKPLSPKTKAGYITATRTFFGDLQEWEWIPRRFDPLRALATPPTVTALIGPDPRIIADDVWAKLLWAGLNMDVDDLPANSSGPSYPMEFIRAVTLTWLFSGQRSDEIARLRVGCIRWQHNNAPIRGDSTEVLVKDAVCLLDIPTHKTGTAFTKPVDPLLGQAIEAWQAVRPDQPKMLDRKTGEHVDLLFAIRVRRVAKAYINDTIIPALCRKAGVPTADVRGNITSHRARATIASQLYNAKEPMTLYELQAWLGHRSPESTRHYAKISPMVLVKAYRDAGYFARNVRTIEVLVDRDAVTSGAAAAGQPWQYYDLGHGYCTYTFFEQCPHRMACAHCDFYTPKPSSRGQLLEAKENLQRMATSIPLTDEERAAVDDGQAALDQLLSRLVDMPTPAGPTPREIGAPASATLLPTIDLGARCQQP